jgi:phosphoglycerate dehydrogenase-like enzyme
MKIALLDDDHDLARDAADWRALPADCRLEHPLLTLDNVVLTPHLGYVTREVYQGFYRETLENILAYRRGEMRRVANPELWERRRVWTG